MSDPKGQPEPSMEEILASIRRIIAEDGDAPPAADDKAARHDEILELTEVVEEDGTVVSLTPGGKKPMLEPVPSVPPPAPAAPPVKRAAPPPPPPEPAFETKPVSAPEPEPPPRADRLMSGAA